MYIIIDNMTCFQCATYSVSHHCGDLLYLWVHGVAVNGATPWVHVAAYRVSHHCGDLMQHIVDP